jgi:GT2 family glycosyltransferase
VSRVAAVTAAVAACDRPDGVARCLDGLLAGELLPAELIVVDQSRDDAVEKVVRRVGRTDIAVRYVRQPRTGLSDSRNAAVAHASQPVVAFTDDDCVPHPRWLLAVSTAFAAPDGPEALTGRVLPLGEERPGTFVVSPRAGTERIDFRGRTIPWRVGTGGNFAARREWLERIGPFDSRLGAGSPGKAAEDADLLYRLLLAGATVRYDPDAIVYHERQTEAQRLASRAGYGFGIGAFCGLWLRRGDWYAARLMLGWVGLQAGLLVKAGLRGNRFLARQRRLSLGGGVRGLAYGLRLSDR